MRTRVHMSEHMQMWGGRLSVLLILGVRHWIPRASWLARLADTGELRAQHRPCFNKCSKEWLRKTANTNSGLLTCTHMHHTHANMNTHMHTTHAFFSHDFSKRRLKTGFRPAELTKKINLGFSAGHNQSLQHQGGASADV